MTWRVGPVSSTRLAWIDNERINDKVGDFAEFLKMWRWNGQLWGLLSREIDYIEWIICYGLVKGDLKSRSSKFHKFNLNRYWENW